MERNGSCRRCWQWAGCAAALIVCLACSSSAEPPSAKPMSAAPESAAAQPARMLIEPLQPRRDFVGPAPDTFTWTAVPNADSYIIGVWNEVDVLLWRQDGLHEVSIPRPDALRFEPGTYFWSVFALRDGEAIGESGRTAFVVHD